jgi:hypothetical protein
VRPWAVSGYAGMVTLLVGSSLVTPDSVAPVLYLIAVGLTLPIGVTIYPALMLNALAVGVLSDLLGMSQSAADMLQGAGMLAAFAVAALLNGAVVSYAWRSMRRNIKPAEPDHHP